MHTLDLRSHGFLSVKLDDSMANLCDALPNAKHILRIDRSKDFAGDTWYFLNMDNGICVGYTTGQFLDKGTYGKIYKAKRIVLSHKHDNVYDIVSHPEEIVIKQVLPEKGSYMTDAEVRAHTSEALLHVLSWKIMQSTLTPWGIPRPYEVYGDNRMALSWMSMYMGMSFVEGDILHALLRSSWSVTTRAENTRMFREIMANVAYILHCLQTGLHLNHRDLKVNNILVRKRADPLELTLDGVKVSTTMDVTVVDFGFACVGCNKGPTLFQAGSWFPFSDICYKKGRDLAQLIYCINCYFPLDEYLTPDMYGAIRNIMRITWSGGTANALDGFTKEGEPRMAKTCTYDTGIYEFLRRDEVDPILCEPSNVFSIMA